MTPTGGNAYFGDGLSEELSAQLARIPGVRVSARTSAFEFKGKNVDVRKIGEALGCATCWRAAFAVTTTGCA